MNWAEHQFIVCEARKLLHTRPHLQGGAKNTFITNAFFDLHAAYTGRDVELVVSKGIHQPRNPHIQLRTTSRRSGKTYTFHLNVSAVDEGLANRFRWEAVQFTLWDEHQYSWPVGAQRVTRAERSRSISSNDPVLERYRAKLQDARDAEFERVRAAEAARRQAASAAIGEQFESVALPAFKEKWKLGKGDFDVNRPGFAKFKAGTGQFNVKIRGTGYPVKYDKGAGAIVFVNAAPVEL
ncbi:MAG: hypothetical protein ABJF01_18945 [bacterium]